MIVSDKPKMANRTVRLIPRLDVKSDRLVKGVQLEGIRPLGDPSAFAADYYNEGADELLYLDVVASLYQRNSLLDLVSRTASSLFIPLTVGGGIRSEDDVRQALRAGADKVAINTGGVRNPDVIRSASRKFGASTIVVSIEAKRQTSGTYEVYIDGGRERTGLEVTQWARTVEALGAGEILLTSIDQDGTGSGFDLGLIKAVGNAVGIPVIASGGAGVVKDVVDLLCASDIQAIAIGSAFHYRRLRLAPPWRPRNGISGLAQTGFSIGEAAAAAAHEGFLSRASMRTWPQPVSDRSEYQG